MKVFSRICLKDYTVEAQNGDKLELKRGREYTTSEENNDKVVVFSNFWVPVPVNIFGGEEILCSK